MFHQWYPAMMNGIGGDAATRAKGVQANAEYHAYLDPLIEARRREPQDDLLSRLAVAEVDDQHMTSEEIKSFASLILVAGAETTDKAIANLWYQLLANPDQWEAVRKDPDLLDRAFTEMMRIHPPAGGQARRAINDVTMHGEVIPAGAYVQLSIYGGNRDERVFKDPDRFDVERSPNDHVAFGGYGAHFCLGASLARLELRVMFEELIARLPDLKLTSDAPLPRRPSNFITGYENMPVEL